MYPRVADMILDIETCKPGPEEVQWQRQSYIKLNYGLRVRSQDWQTACWQQGQEQQAEPGILAVDINPWTPSLHNTEGELSKEQFHTELAE